MRAKRREQLKAQNLRTRGKSVNEIAHELGVSKGSVSIWVRRVELTHGQQAQLQFREKNGAAKGRDKIIAQWKKYRRSNPKPQPNQTLIENRSRIGKFFLEWTPESAYVLGYFAADGCMYHSRNGGFYNGGFYIQFDSTDKELLLSVQKLMKIFNKVERKIQWSREDNFNRKQQYKLRIVSKRAYQRLLEIGFTPAKSLNLCFPDIPREVLHHFVRGYFDGDGHVHIGQYIVKNRKNPIKVFQTGFTSGSRHFLEKLQQNLFDYANLGRGSLHPHGSNWALTYSSRDSRQLYNFMYPTTTVPCLKRKRDIFDKALAV